MALVVGTHYRDQIFDGSLGPGSIHYMHIKRSSSSNRTAGTMEMICCGELGGTQAGNGLAYYKAAWCSWSYITDGAHSIDIVENTRENDGATGTSIFVVLFLVLHILEILNTLLLLLNLSTRFIQDGMGFLR
ncbi:MAG: hypothetical protein CM15mV89_0700 [Caudoviricetes sp.]|nr:MAG: hypothetical protein CM15mV89_0700 [Caudoviricetes sp.]